MAHLRLDEDGGLEKQCTKCGDWWTNDTEFFSAYKGSTA